MAFALAKAADDIKDYGRAFDAYIEGNAISRKSAPFDMEREARQVDAIEVAFNSDLLSRLRPRTSQRRADLHRRHAAFRHDTHRDDLVAPPRRARSWRARDPANLGDAIVGASPISEARPLSNA